MSHDPTSALVARLESAGFDPKPTGPDSWESRCPAHNGDRRNLSIKRGDDGRALLHCQAHQCSPRSIVESLNMKMSDLFPPHVDPAPRPHVNGKAPSGATHPHATPEAAIKATEARLGQHTGSWVYHDATGVEIARVYRFDHEGKKEFRPIHWTSTAWVMGDPPETWPLYNLPQLANADRVFVCEGEKAADLAASLGCTATTSAHGAKSARKTDWTPLAGKEVVILPDHDGAGESYARSVIELLAELSPQPTVKVVRLKSIWQTNEPIAEGSDIAEWIESGVPDTWTNLECRAELARAADAAEAVDFDSEPTAESQVGPEPLIGPGWPDPPEAEAFAGLAGEIVRVIEPHTESDPAAILIQLLVGFGNLIGRSAYFAVESDRHYANEFVALVGDTAKGRKGTSWGHARNTLEAIDPTWTATRVLTGLSTGEGLIHAVRDPMTKREPIRDGKRITGYQDVETDAGESDKRILCIEPELGGTLRVATRDGNSLSALVRQAWDSGDLRTLTRNNPLRATGAHVSIIGHVTSEELVSLLSRIDAANGFANRFLWMAVRRSRLLPFGGSSDPAETAPMVHRLKEAAEFGRTFGRVDRDHEANELWAKVYPALSEGRPGLLGAVTSRAEAHTMRLAMLYALIDQSHVIRADHLRSALALWKYAERSAAYIFGDSLGDPGADTLLDAIRAAMPKGMTRTEIREGVFQRHKSSTDIGRMLGKLAAVGLAHNRTESTAGRPAERWFAGRDPAP